MKKFASVLLVMVIILGLSVTATAETYETEVAAEGTGTEAFVLVVPEDLTAGGNAGTVSLTGTWPSNKVICVEAPDSLELTNSISGADKKTTNIVFNDIKQVGSNTESIAVTENISVDGIENALFGTWSGSFSYTLTVKEYSSLANTTWKLNDTVSDYENVFQPFNYDEQSGWKQFPAGTMLHSEYTDATGGSLDYELSGFSRLTIPSAFTVFATVYHVNDGCLYVPENEVGIPAGWYAGNTRPYLNGTTTNLQELFAQFRPCTAPSFTFGAENCEAVNDIAVIDWLYANGVKQVNP